MRYWFWSASSLLASYKGEFNEVVVSLCELHTCILEDLVTMHKWVQGYYILYGSGIVYCINDNLIIYTAKHLEPLPHYMDQDTACLLSVYLPKISVATDEFKEALDLLNATFGHLWS